MKLPNPSQAKRRNNEGIAVIVMLALLGLILAFIFANLSALRELRGNLKLIEQKQIRRLNESTTNAPDSTTVTTNSPIAAASKPRRE